MSEKRLVKRPLPKPPSGNAALDRANKFAREMGIEDEPTPEILAGAESYLEDQAPGLSQRVLDPTKRRAAARAAIQAQAASDPDSLLHKFGLHKIEQTIRDMVDNVTGTREAEVQQGDPDLGPATAQQGTEALSDPRFQGQ